MKLWIRIAVVGLLVFLGAISLAATAEAGAPASFEACPQDTSLISNATIYIPSNFETAVGDSLQVDDQIALFTDDDICAGLGTWDDASLAITIYGSDPWSSFDGYEEQDALQFKVWDASTQTTYATSGTYEPCSGDSLSACEDSGHYTADALYTLSGFTAASEAQLAGTASYYPGGPNGGPALEEASLELRALSDGNLQQSILTAPDGSFSLTASTGQSYTLSAKQATPGGAAANGITALDLSLMRQHLLGISDLGPYPQMAADVSGDAVTTTNDLSQVRQLILGLRQGFGPGGAKRWDCAVTGASSAPGDTARSYDPLTTNQAGQDFYCFRLGDVNGDWQPSGGSTIPALAEGSSASSFATRGSSASRASASTTSGSQRTTSRQTQKASAQAQRGPAPPVHVQIENQTVEAALSPTETSPPKQPSNTLVTVPVRAGTDFEDVGGLQFTLEWNAEALSFAGVTVPAGEPPSETSPLPGLSPQANFGRHRTDEGLLSFVWAHPQAGEVTLAEGQTLFAVRFRVKTGHAAEAPAAINFSSKVTTLGAYRAEERFSEGPSPLLMRAARLEGEGGTVAFEALPEGFALEGNYPNPFHSQTTLRFDLPEPAKVSVGVFDALGRRVLERTEEMEGGRGQEITIEAGQFSSGVYLYRMIAELPSGRQVKTGRMILVR